MNHHQLNPALLPIIQYEDKAVVTTELLALFYDTDQQKIRQNFNNNKSRFVQGKHFFKLSGDALKAFRRQLEDLAERSCVENFDAAFESLKFPSQINLWTARGAARHAKMLNTDQAWEVFERLEDAYFNRSTLIEPISTEEKRLLLRADEQLAGALSALSRSSVKLTIKKVHRQRVIKLGQMLEIDLPPAITNEQRFKETFSSFAHLPQVPSFSSDSSDWDFGEDDELSDEEIPNRFN
jgi:hypothetical protein